MLSCLLRVFYRPMDPIWLLQGRSGEVLTQERSSSSCGSSIRQHVLTGGLFVVQQGVLERHSQKMCGVLNGIDHQVRSEINCTSRQPPSPAQLSFDCVLVCCLRAPCSRPCVSECVCRLSFCVCPPCECTASLCADLSACVLASPADVEPS